MTEKQPLTLAYRKHLVASMILGRGSEYDAIIAMNELFEIPNLAAPAITPTTATRLRAFREIVRDELTELDEILVAIEAAELAQVIDNEDTQIKICAMLTDLLCDLSVFILSEISRNGINYPTCMLTIMHSMATKLDENLEPFWNEDRTKFQKGPGYMAPEPLLEKFIAWQRYNVASQKAVKKAVDHDKLQRLDDAVHEGMDAFRDVIISKVDQ